MKTKEEFKFSLALHTGRVDDSGNVVVSEGCEKLSNYHAVCIELERARALYGTEFSDSLVKKFNLRKYGIRESSI
jgi:hypothetical protein